jgi:hypothetical protein
VDHHFHHWTSCLDDGSQDDELRPQALSAGLETLFNLDILRQSNYLELESKVFAKIREYPTASGLLPDLLTAYIHSIKRHRGTLFSQASSSSGLDSYASLRQNALRFFQCSVDVLASRPNPFSSEWGKIRVNLLEILEQENVYSAFTGRESIDATRQQCLEALQHSAGRHRCCILKIFCLRLGRSKHRRFLGRRLPILHPALRPRHCRRLVTSTVAEASAGAFFHYAVIIPFLSDIMLARAAALGLPCICESIHRPALRSCFQDKDR